MGGPFAGTMGAMPHYLNDNQAKAVTEFLKTFFGPCEVNRSDGGPEGFDVFTVDCGEEGYCELHVRKELGQAPEKFPGYWIDRALHNKSHGPNVAERLIDSSGTPVVFPYPEELKP